MKKKSVILYLLCGFTALVALLPVRGALEPASTAVVDVNGDLSRSALQDIQRRVEAARRQHVSSIVFSFNNPLPTSVAQSHSCYDTFADLGRLIARLGKDDNINTIAFIPKQAMGMSMLAVLACKTIAADEFAQLGRVLPARRTVVIPAEETAPQSVLPDEQALANLISLLAEAAGHDPLLARAMVQKRLILYRLEKNGRSEIVDQAGFTRYLKDATSGWKLVGTGPLVGGDEVLLLNGRQGRELGLISCLAADRNELAQRLNLNIVSLGVPVSAPDDSGSSIKARPARVTFPPDQQHKAVFIVCSEMVDEGLYESIKRRSEQALADGATYLIYEMDTFGGRVDSAHSIYDYILQDVGRRAHTVAYVRTKAISAGALISVACSDIIMKANTQIGDCAPIMIGGKLEGVEREKMESPLRSFFAAAAQANNYPVAICEAMVTISIEVWQVKNLQTGSYEYFKGTDLPTDRFKYDLDNKKLIDSSDKLLTLSAEKALEYGLACAVVNGLDDQAREQVLSFLEKRDGVKFPRPAPILTTNWSEEMVRWLTSPTISGILFMIALLGIYAELNSPGLGLPGAIAVTALLVLFGSKFLIGLANWWEIALFIVGFGLLMLEIFVIPGFGITGISGTLMMMFALGSMMVANKPDEWPVPVSNLDWQVFRNNLYSMLGGFAGFLIGAWLLARFLPKIPLANRLVLSTKPDPAAVREGVSHTKIAGAGATPPHAVSFESPPVRVGQKGISLTPLRPAGRARFDRHKIDVVSRGGLIPPDTEVEIVEVEGNRVVVKPAADL